MPDDLDPTANTQKFRAFVQRAERDEATRRPFAGVLFLVALLMALVVVAVIWLVVL